MTKTKSPFELRPNETIWIEWNSFIRQACDAFGDELTEEIAKQIMLSDDVIESVCAYLGAEEKQVRKVIADMLDPTWYELYEKLIFPLERAWNAESDPDTPKEGSIYIIFDPETSLHKIGRSINPEDRLNSLNRNLAPGKEQYRILHQFLCPKYGAVAVEKYLHKKFDSVQIEREWYALDMVATPMLLWLLNLETDEVLEFVE